MNEKTLNNCLKDHDYFITGISLENKNVARRLSELGFYQGASFRVIGISALKKTFLIQIGGFTLSLRASVGQLVSVREK